MSDPTITAVIPAHQAQAALSRSLSSVFAQSSPPDEVLVVDDGSSDGTGAIARAHRDVRVLRREQGGPGGYAARNLAIRDARGDWIAFLDADDVWRPGWIAAARAAIACAPADVGAAFASRTIAWADGRSAPQSALPAGVEGPLIVDFGGFLALWKRLGRCPMWTSATLLRRSAALEAGLFPEERCRRGGDKDLWLRVMARTRGVALSFDAAVYHLGVAGQVTGTTGMNTPHCLAPTIEALAATAPTHARALRRILNREIFRYGVRSFGRADGRPEWARDLTPLASPGLALAAYALAATPLPAQRALRRALDRARRRP